MKQIVRRVIDRKGKVAVIELPAPHLGPNQVLVQNAFTVISTGTESSTLSKTPAELVKQTISDPWMRHVVTTSIFATGPMQTARRVWTEMLMPREIGYTGAGKVLEVGAAVADLRVGDTVAYAARGHAELVNPAINHTVAVPAGVDLRHAAFVTLGGIALQGVRRADLRLGEVVVVYGLGLVGQLVARIAKASGCTVVGIDVSAARNDLARQGGVDLVIDPAETDVKRRVLDFTGKHGADATIICARSDDGAIVNAAIEMTRKQGRVVIVGYVRMDVHPKNMFPREIDLRFSRAYGPGSYHMGYEKGRLDYPYAYVRWTEKRNLEEFIRLIATKAIDLEPLIGAVFPIARAQEAFDAVAAGTLPGVAALIGYEERAADRSRTLSVRPRTKASGKIGISVVGVGNHVLGKHLPYLRSMKDVEIRGLVSATGRNASIVAERVDATVITTDLDAVLADEGTDAVMICSTQPEHADHVKRAIKAGKAVFVEKPMVTVMEDFAEVTRLMSTQPVLFTLGLNRRYSPLVAKLREMMQAPVQSLTYTIATPFTPPEHWSLDEIEGGGRLITEGEHFIDLCNVILGKTPISVFARAVGKPPDDLRKLTSYVITLHYEDAVANVIFTESGAVNYPRERLVANAPGQVAELDDFGRLTVYGRKRQAFGGGIFKEMGHQQELRQFVAALRGEPNHMLTWAEAAAATQAMFAAQESMRAGAPVYLADFHQQLLSIASQPSAEPALGAR